MGVGHVWGKNACFDHKNPDVYSGGKWIIEEKNQSIIVLPLVRF